MLQEILLEFFPNLLETFDENVLTRLPSGGSLRGVYDPNAPPSGLTSTTSTGLSSATMYKNYTLRYYKKPANLIPVLDSNNDPVTFLEIYGLSPEQDATQSQGLQNALNACTKYSNCWGITIENMEFGISIPSSYPSYTFKLMQKPTSGIAANENLICNKAHYTYLKEDNVLSPSPPECIFSTPTIVPSISTDAPTKLPSWWNSKPYVPVPKPSIWSNPLLWIVIISILFIIGVGIYYIVTKKPVDYTAAIKQLKKIKSRR